MMKKILLLATVLIVSCLFCAGGVWGLPWGEELCVDPAGGTGVDYTDLQSALTYAQSSGTSDLIKVVQGTYTGNFTYSSDEGIYLYGGYTSGCASRVVNPANTVLDGGGSGKVLQLYSSTDPSITVDGFTIQHGGSTGLYVNMNNSNSTGDIDSGDIEITNNIITSNTSTSDGGALLRTNSTHGSSGNVTVVNNVISGNTTTSTNWVSGIEASSSSSDGIAGTVTFTNNTITGNINPAGSPFGGTYMSSSGTSSIVNCYNNIIRGNTPWDIYVGGITKNGYNNNYHNISGIWTNSGGTIDADPLFVDPGHWDGEDWVNGDYHLRPNSPCIDTGFNTAPEIPGYDFEGDPRTIGSAPDMGADEFVPDFVILHKDGALWSSATGWEMSSPPYYPGTNYARDLELVDSAYQILHKDGAIYDSVTGWDYTAYYAGSDYAVDLEIVGTDETIILDRDGALWSSDTGWILSSPPYYAGSDYARALEVRADESYVILHKDGALYDSAAGWVTTKPPYYPGTAWVVDLKLEASGYVLLHKDGALWSSSGGWTLTSPPYYAGSDYARALEVMGTRYSILHKDGGIYDSVDGWDLTPYYAGSNYAVDLEVQ